MLARHTHTHTHTHEARGPGSWARLVSKLPSKRLTRGSGTTLARLPSKCVVRGSWPRQDRSCARAQGLSLATSRAGASCQERWTGAWPESCREPRVRGLGGGLGRRLARRQAGARAGAWPASLGPHGRRLQLTHSRSPSHTHTMTQPPAGQLSAFYPPYYQGGGGGGGQLDPHLNLANDLRLVYQHTSYKERVARATRNVLDQVCLHLCA